MATLARRAIPSFAGASNTTLRIPPRSTTAWGYNLVKTVELSLIAHQTTRDKHSGRRPFSNPARASDQTDKLRHLMRLVAHPVAVITSSESSGRAPIDRYWRGATVSSFNTVTFTPYPVVSFNIKRQSATFQAIESSRLFNVHLLRDTKEAEMLADRFAAGNDARPFHDDDGELRQFAHVDDAVGEVEGVQKERGGVDEGVSPPIIRFRAQEGSEEYTSFRIQCEYMSGKTAEIGDHVVVFGKVTSVDQHSQLQTENGSRLCLLYVDRAYGRVST